MLRLVSGLLASLSMALKQPLAGYCDVETTHGDALVTKQGDYCTFLRIGGMKRMATRDDITRLADDLRLDLSGALESRGHAIVGWYLSDPDMAAREIERVNMESCRRVGREVGSISPTFSTSDCVSGARRCAGSGPASCFGPAAPF
jgi:intracellular multiplication protein IcmB